MSRSFGSMGLPRNFPDLQRELGLRHVSEGEFKEYFYSEGYAFKIYEDNRGQEYEEYECGCPWDGGPTLYLGLRKRDTKEIVLAWTPSQMGFYEQVELPEAYDPRLRDGFIEEYNLPLVKGYCPLYVELGPEKLCLYQDVEHTGSPDHIYREIDLIRSEDGPVILDWLRQQGLSVEEISDLYQLRFYRG